MKDKLKDLIVLLRGGGEMASGVAHRLTKSHLRVCITEISHPLAVRRGVSFCEAIYDGRKEVEGIGARRVESLKEIFTTWEKGEIPILVDPEAHIKEDLRPQVLVDAIVAKKNLGTKITDAPLVIGLGPDFTCGVDCHLVVETNRGHNLGRLLTEGSAQPNTGIPGSIEGYTSERVLRAGEDGNFSALKTVGDKVKAAEVVAYLNDTPIKAKIDGVIRGLIRNGTVKKGTKLGDVDPRGIKEYCFTISEKARAIAGGVLEGIMLVYNR